ncbi:MAG: tripartite tricarboxylate transporter permease, partial [Roseovarius sp.]|nr:tripartite tricarboxylate transporter permease [Roseovarius sp.]
MGFFVDATMAVFAAGPLTAMFGATLLGVLIGALPGLNPVMAIALLLPLTYSMEPLVALAMVAGIYNGSMYGGAIPAILLRIPGTP